VVSNKTPKEIENMKKDICKILSENGLKIIIEENKKIINILDPTLNLNKKTYTLSQTVLLNIFIANPTTYQA